MRENISLIWLPYIRPLEYQLCCYSSYSSSVKIAGRRPAERSVKTTFDTALGEPIYPQGYIGSPSAVSSLGWWRRRRHSPLVRPLEYQLSCCSSFRPCSARIAGDEMTVFLSVQQGPGAARSQDGGVGDPIPSRALYFLSIIFNKWEGRDIFLVACERLKSLHPAQGDGPAWRPWALMKAMKISKVGTTYHPLTRILCQEQMQEHAGRERAGGLLPSAVGPTP
jgi:hypothetical protein